MNHRQKKLGGQDRIIYRGISTLIQLLHFPTDFHLLNMPASQLKRLKASLRAEGLIGPQPSKTEKKRQRKSGVSEDRKIRRVSALQNIREQFNPFETQIPSQQRAKFEVTSLKNVNGKVQKSVKGRPGVSKGYGEEKVGDN